MGIQDIIERVKYADDKLKKQIILGSVAGVLFIAAGIFLVRGMMGPAPAEAPTQVQQAADELRKKLESDQPDAEPEQIEGSQEPFTGAPQPIG